MFELRFSGPTRASGFPAQLSFRPRLAGSMWYWSVHGCDWHSAHLAAAMPAGKIPEGNGENP